MRPRKIPVGVAIALGILAAVPVYVILKSWVQTSSVFWPKEQFTAQRWGDLPQSERYRLYRDLDDRRVLLGRTRPEVVALLGTPSFSTEDFIAYAVKDRTPREYSLNFVYVLRIHLDEEGRVQSYLIVSD